MKHKTPKTPILLIFLALVFACLSTHAQHEITEILPPGIYDLSTSRHYESTDIPTITNRRVEIVYEDSQPFVIYEGQKKKVFYRIGERLIPTIMFYIEPTQEGDMSTDLVIYSAISRRAGIPLFEGKRHSMNRGRRDPFDAFFNLRLFEKIEQSD
jgi:hypothetical protein